MMHYITLGKTNMKISDSGFGAWAIGGMDWGTGKNDADAMEALKVSLENGVTFYDTCEQTISTCLCRPIATFREGICEN